jgi:hypothetical protein
MRMDRIYSTQGEEKECMQNFYGKTRREDVTRKANIKVYLRDTGWVFGVDYSGSGQRPEMGSCEHGTEPSDPIR